MTDELECDCGWKGTDGELVDCECCEGTGNHITECGVEVDCENCHGTGEVCPQCGADI